MMSITVAVVIAVVAAVVFAVVGFIAGSVLRQKANEKEIGSATQEATKIINDTASGSILKTLTKKYTSHDDINV